MSSDGNASIRRENLVDDAIGADEVETGVLAFTHLSSGIISSQAQAEGGINANTLLTPERVKQAINALAPATQNATEAVAGRGQLATLANMASHTILGSSGASLLIQNKNVTKTPDRYTPAYLTGGTAAESNYAIWDNVSDGSCRGTVDGTTYNFDGMDFSLVTDMDGVASVVQVKMRAITGTDITVVWSTDHFVYTSVNSTSASEVSVLTTSTGTVGTDISGVGVAYLDSESGQGTATAAVLDKTLDAGMVPLLLDTGEIDYRRVPAISDAEAAAGTSDLKFMTADKTVHLLNNLTSGVATSLAHTRTAKTTLVDADFLLLGDSAASNVDKKATLANFRTALLRTESRGAQSRSTGDGSGTQVITGVGFEPKLIIISATYQHGAAETCKSDGFDGEGGSKCTFQESSNQAAITADSYADRCVHLSAQGVTKWTAHVSSVEPDGFTITWAASSPAAGVKFSYTCIG